MGGDTEDYLENTELNRSIFLSLCSVDQMVCPDFSVLNLGDHHLWNTGAFAWNDDYDFSRAVTVTSDAPYSFHIS